MTLENEYWQLSLAAHAAQLQELSFAAHAGGPRCANLLKTASIAQPLTAMMTLTGGQTGYTDAAGTLHASSSCTSATVRRDDAHTAVIENISYGAVRESWTLRLEGPRLRWLVRQEWLEDAEITDAFVPALFFAAASNWGEATVFQWWSTAAAQDDFYGNAKAAVVPDSVVAVSRRTARERGQEMVAKLLSHACPAGDVRVASDGYLKKAEVTNYCSYLGQTSFCEPLAPRTMKRGEVVELALTLAPELAPTGLQMEVALRGPLAAVAERNRRFYDVYANCGIIADTDSWWFGNSPSGYVALFCQYMYSEIIRFGVPGGPLAPEGWDGHQALRFNIRAQSANLRREGTIGNRYIPDALDNLPAYLIAARDLLSLTGDASLGEEIYPAARIAFEKIAENLREGNGMIVSSGDHCADYWDWIARDGVVTSINVLTHAALGAFAETAGWVGQSAAAAEARELEAGLKARFNAELWDEERGFYADWKDLAGEKHFYFYALPQLHGIVRGLVPPERARRLVDAVRERRRELGPEWEQCFSIQTNFFDARERSTVFQGEADGSSRFGETMNGGCLASWNYYWIGALCQVGLVEEAVDAWKRVVDRFAGTSLVEDSNYWDYAGRPSRTTPPGDARIAYELCLADQGLVSVAPLRWLLGVNSTLSGLTVNPVLPASQRPASVRVPHLGKIETVFF